MLPQNRMNMLLLALLASMHALTGVAAVTCTQRTMDPGFVGGGFLNDQQYLVVNTYNDDTGVYTMMYVRDVTTGNIVRSTRLDLGSTLAITCPNKEYIAISMKTQPPEFTPPIVQPYMYYGNGTQLGTCYRSTYDYGDFQMYLSPDCMRLLIRTDDEKSETHDVRNLYTSSSNYFDSRKDGPWMQMQSQTTVYTGDKMVMRKYILKGRGSQSRRGRLMYTFKVQGSPRNFAVSPNGHFMFVVGRTANQTAFKNLVLTSGRGRITIDNDSNDLDSLYSAYSSTGKHFAGIFERAGGNVVKVYNSTGSYNGQLQHVLLPNSAAIRMYFSPNAAKLLVFGNDPSRKYWMCGDFE